MTNEQTNTRAGLIPAIAGEDLQGLEGRLVKIVAFLQGQPVAVLPDHADEECLYVIEDGGDVGEVISLLPLTPSRQIRIRLDGAIAAGARVVLAEPDGDVDGMVTAVGVAGDFSPGLTEESGVDGQMVLVRAWPRFLLDGESVVESSESGSGSGSESSLN